MECGSDAINWLMRCVSESWKVRLVSSPGTDSGEFFRESPSTISSRGASLSARRANLTRANGLAMKRLVALFMCSLPLAVAGEPTVRELNVAVVQFESIDGDITGNL